MLHNVSNRRLELDLWSSSIVVRFHTYSLKQWKCSITRCPNSNFPELFEGFEFRILNWLKNYLGGSNFKLRIRTRFISRLFGFRIDFERNYDRTFSLFQGMNPISDTYFSRVRISNFLFKHDFPFCWCCPAGGLDFEKSWFVVFIWFSLRSKTFLFARIWASGVC